MVQPHWTPSVLGGCAQLIDAGGLHVMVALELSTVTGPRGVGLVPTVVGSCKVGPAPTVVGSCKVEPAPTVVGFTWSRARTDCRGVILEWGPCQLSWGLGCNQSRSNVSEFPSRTRSFPPTNDMTEDVAKDVERFPARTSSFPPNK